MLDACTGADGVGEIIVVADACTDSTAEIASSYGVVVIESSAHDKSGAVALGMQQVSSPLTLLCDADLHGLRAGHIEYLMTAPPLDGMVYGLFDERRSKWTQGLPPITGERRLSSDLIRRVVHPGMGYEMELAIDAEIGRLGLPTRGVILTGVTNTEKHSGKKSWRELGGLTKASLTHLDGLVRYVRQGL